MQSRAEQLSPWALCVAPMMDWTDRYCRRFHRALAPGARLYSEMLTAAAVIHGDRARLLGFDAAEQPLALQLGGSDPAQLAEAARIGADHGYAEINLNVGCPSGRVRSGGFGACLMLEPRLVADCVAAMQAAVDVPVTVKCRLGVDEQSEDEALEALVEALLPTGLEVLIVHARKAWLDGLSPKENRNVPPLNPQRVYRLKREHPQLVVVLNGGIADAGAAMGHLQHVDGVMLGRAAYHQPWVLAELQRRLHGDALPQRAAVLRELRPWLDEVLAAGVPLQHVARHLLGLFHGEPGGRRFRRVLSEEAHRAGADWSVLERALERTRAAPAPAADLAAVDG